MKTNVLRVIVLLIGSTIPMRADENSSKRGFVSLNYPSVAMTMTKGNELMDKGDYEGARRYYDVAIGQDPKAWPPYFNRANLFMNERKWDLAIQDLNTALRLAPGLLLIQVLRGQIYEEIGNYSRALADYERIVRITPPSLPFNLGFALNSRAWLRATCPDASFRHGKQAVTDAKLACTCTSWTEAAYIDTPAAAHAEGGDFDSAIRFEEKAIKGLHEDKWSIKDPQRRRAYYQDQLASYQRRLALYQRRQPYRSALK